MILEAVKAFVRTTVAEHFRFSTVAVQEVSPPLFRLQYGLTSHRRHRQGRREGETQVLHPFPASPSISHSGVRRWTSGNFPGLG
jgi:hypothetical protein